MASVNAPTTEQSRTGEFRHLLKFAAPLIVNNLALAGMGLTDTIMAGRGLGPAALAAVAVGSSVWFLFFFIPMGILTAISPLSARHIGKGRPEMVGRYARQGFYLSLLLSAVIMAVLFFGARPALYAIGIDPEFRDVTADYIRAILWGAPAMFAYLVLRYTTEAAGHTLPIMIVSVAGLVVNVIGNYAFMFGHLGMPALGAEGAGVASACTMWATVAIMLAYVLRKPLYTQFRIFELGRGPSWPEMRAILALGVPIMVSIVAEAGLFSAVSLLMGRLSAVAAAAHQIAMNYATFMFMIPLALNSATTVLVSQAVGRGELDLARRRGIRGIVTCALFMAASATVLLLFRDQIVGLYTKDTAVQMVALSLLFMAAIFQISDGLQVGASGALRGLHDTRVPMYMTTVAYWIIGFPLAWLAATRENVSPAMIWAGLVVGLTLAAFALVGRFFWTTASSQRIQALIGDDAA
ncbi:MAG: MATE family efflux transporter [Pseudomonadota bacterium]